MLYFKYCFVMKNLINSFTVKSRVLLCSLMVALGSVSAYAQDAIANQITQGVSQNLAGIIPGVITVMKVIVGLLGIIFLIRVISNIVSGEQDAAKKAGFWLVGLAGGFVVLTILGNVNFAAA